MLGRSHSYHCAEILSMHPLPPNGLPIYRLLTGPDDATFCHRVSEALALGYRLHGSPALTFNGTSVIAAQALVWPDNVNE